MTRGRRLAHAGLEWMNGYTLQQHLLAMMAAWRCAAVHSARGVVLHVITYLAMNMPVLARS